MTLPPEMRAALRRQWFDDLAAEIARRSAVHAGNADQAQQQLLAELHQMGERLVSVSIPERAERQSMAAIVEELAQANGDWSRIDAIRIKADMAPAEAVAIVLRRDPKLALRMLARWSRRPPPSAGR